MDNYGTLHETGERFTLRFERYFPQPRGEVFRVITNPVNFAQWYPFATGEMELRRGGEIHFDDGEGTTYKAVITEFDEPQVFAFHEEGDKVHLSLQEEEKGCRLIFAHTFDDGSWAVNTAAGWHRCLDALQQIVNGHPVEWAGNAAELREHYEEALKRKKQ